MDRFWKKLRKAKRLGDFGYISYPKALFPGYWWKDQLDFAHDVLAMDRPPTSRQEVYPDYKHRRKDKRQEDPSKLARHEKVKAFRRLAEENPLLFTVYLDGYEADDLVAVIHLYYMHLGTPRPVVAVDKDLLQVPGLADLMQSHLGDPVNRQIKLPKYARTKTLPDPWQMVVLQALFGDKSDSIPRLLPSSGWEAKRKWDELHPRDSKRSPTSHLEALRTEFGPDFTRNMRLVLIPDPSLREPTPTDDELLELVGSGSYWRQWSAWEPGLEEVGRNWLRYINNDSPW